MQKNFTTPMPPFLRGIFVALCIFAAVNIMACEKWKTATISYEAIGEALAAYQTTAQELCAFKKVDAETCEKLKTSYNKIRDNYIKAGDLLVDAMKTEDAVTKESVLKNYHEIIAQLIVDFGDVRNLLEANGVQLDFAKLIQ